MYAFDMYFALNTGVICAHKNMNELDKSRMKHFKYQFERNHADLKRLSNLAKKHCNLNKPISEQPHCNFIMEEMIRTEHRARDLDMDFMLFHLSIQKRDDDIELRPPYQ